MYTYLISRYKISSLSLSSRGSDFLAYVINRSLCFPRTRAFYPIPLAIILIFNWLVNLDLAEENPFQKARSKVSMGKEKQPIVSYQLYYALKNPRQAGAKPPALHY
jgi:hypothetical protein